MGLSVCFRADAATWIGIGHVMRCLTLADMLRERGHSCRFVCREHAGNLIEHIRGKGYAVAELPGVHQLPSAHSVEPEQLTHGAWLGCDWREDATQTLATLSDDPVDWLIVDHYALDIRWESQLRSACHRVMVIDDLADRAHDCHLLLDQTFGRSHIEYQPLVAQHTTILCGSQYALLRPEFARLRSESLLRRKTGAVQQLLVTMGGIDQHNATAMVLGALSETQLPANSKVIVVMGGKAPWLDQVRVQAAELDVSVEIRVDVQDMAELMVASDLAIGAAGATTWERCCLGLPTVMVVLAANQIKVALGLKQVGAAAIIDEPQNIAGYLPRLIDGLLGDPQRSRDMSDHAADITDGCGALLVAKCLEVSL